MSNPVIGPQVPQPQHPTPWRVAEKRGDYTVVVNADGNWVAYCTSDDVAKAIVDIVNAHVGTTQH